MISNFAVEEIERLRESGLDPTIRDIIRLNALGLKIDHSSGDDILYQSRRTATVEDVTLFEPTIGHELFLSDMRQRGFDMTDGTTFIIVRSWVLSHQDADSLPSTWTIPGIRKVIGEFVECHFKRVTMTRLTMAVNYVIFGFDSSTLERPAARKEDVVVERTADDESVDDSWNFALGVLHASTVHRLGISLEDARKHTTAEMQAVILSALENDYARIPGGIKAFKDSQRNKYVAEFYATKHEIAERLTKEKDNGH